MARVMRRTPCLGGPTPRFPHRGGIPVRIRNSLGTVLAVISIFAALAIFGHFLPTTVFPTPTVGSQTLAIPQPLPQSFSRCAGGPKVIYFANEDGSSQVGFCGHVVFSGAISSIRFHIALQWSRNAQAPWQTKASAGGVCRNQPSCGGAASTAAVRGYYRVRQLVLVECETLCKSKPVRQVRLSKVIFAP